VEDEPGAVRSASVRQSTNIDRVRALIRQGRHLTIRMIGDELHIVAGRLKAGISESERTSIARERLGNDFPCIIVWETNTFM
jgi:hypothetical protein